MTLLRAFWDAAREIAPERAAEADEGVVMRWCGEGELAELWRVRRPGLRAFWSARCKCEVRRTSRTYGHRCRQALALRGAFCKSLDEADRTALRDAFRQRLQIRRWSIRADRSRLGGCWHSPQLTQTEPRPGNDGASRTRTDDLLGAISATTGTPGHVRCSTVTLGALRLRTFLSD